MKNLIAYHKNSDIVAFERIVNKNNSWDEYTFDKQGNILTYKNSDGSFFEKTYDEQGNELSYKSS